MNAAPGTPAMVLAAGFGKRLRPLTLVTPKPLLEVGGSTLIDRHLDALAAADCQRAVVNVAHLGAKISEHLAKRVGRGEPPALTVIDEGLTPLETGGGIRNALHALAAEQFVIVNGDILCDANLRPFLEEPLPDGVDARLLLVPNPPHHEVGDFTMDGAGVLRPVQPTDALMDRRTYAGIARLRASLIAEAPGDRPAFGLGAVLMAAAAAGRIRGLTHPGLWHDVGTAERLAAARKAVSGEAPTASR